MFMISFNSATTGHQFIRANLTREEAERIGVIAHRRGTNIAVTNTYGRDVTRLLNALATTPANRLAQTRTD